MQISVIIAIMIALLVGESLLGDGSEMNWLISLRPEQTIALLAGMFLLLWSFFRMITKLVLARMERTDNLNRAALKLPARVDLVFQIIILTAFTIHLTMGGWARLIILNLNLGQSILLWELALISPYFVLLLIKWHTFYPVNRFIKEYVVTAHLAEGLSARPVWSRTQYILFNLRHGLLIVLAPILMILTFRDTVAFVFERWFSEISIRAQLENGIVVAGVACIFIFSPVLLRKIWSTRTLPQGPLRQRLESFCRHLKLNYHDILLWDTYSAVANAAMMGIFPPVRYILLSDNLIENMPDDQIEAVFGHEVGHVKLHHIMFLVMFVMASGLCFSFFYDLTLWLIDRYIQWDLDTKYVAYAFPALGVSAAVGWFLLFGWISRRLERQADVYAAASVGQLKQDLNSNTIVAGEKEQSRNLDLHGAMVMAAALERIAMLNGISVYNRSWRHSSIAGRIDFLRTLATENRAYTKFQHTIFAIKTAIVLALLIGATGLMLMNHIKAG